MTSRLLGRHQDKQTTLAGKQDHSGWDFDGRADAPGPFETQPRKCYCGDCRNETWHRRKISPWTVGGLALLVLAACWGPALAVGWWVAPWAGAVAAILLMGLARKLVFPRIHAGFPWICDQCHRVSAEGPSENADALRRGTAAA